MEELSESMFAELLWLQTRLRLTEFNHSQGLYSLVECIPVCQPGRKTLGSAMKTGWLMKDTVCPHVEDANAIDQK